MLFADIFEDVTRLGKKIPTSEYLERGKYPIIDQGQSDIAGYTNEENGLFTDVPVIIFGDHTRAVKYVDTPFFLGADGVKVLKSKIDDVNYKYLYYAVSSVNIPDTGYNRHFKWLKESDIPLPTIEKQFEIVKTLDSLVSLIKLHNQQLNKLDELVRSRFIKMFGDPVSNQFHWKTMLLKNATSKIGSGATPKGGKESYQSEGITLIRSMNVHDGRFEYKDLAHITDEQAKQLDNVVIEENDVFINITGASVARSCIVPKHILPARVNQHVAIIRCVSSMLNPVFANHMFLNTSFKGHLLDIGESGGATRQAITKQQLEMLNVILPPIDLQNVFVTFVEQTDKLKFEVQQSLEKLETLKNSLMQQYFG